MRTQENIQTVKNFFAALAGDKQGVLALATNDIAWIVPGEDWPLADTYRGHAELADFLMQPATHRDQLDQLNWMLPEAAEIERCLMCT